MEREYSPVKLEGDNLIPTFSWEHWESWHDGKYYQPVDEKEVTKRKDLIEAAERDLEKIGELRLSDFQRWVELDWLTPHGHQETTERLFEGFVGEQLELSNEADNAGLNYWPRYEKIIGETKQRALSELGDVLWYLTAQASNVGASLENAYRLYLHEAWEPIRFMEEVAVHDVDEKMSKYVPMEVGRAYVYDDLFDEMQEEGREDMIRDLFFVGVTFNVVASQIFGDPDWIMLDTDKHTRGKIEPLLGMALAFIAHHASRTLDSSLAEVMQVNITKLTQRAASGRLDKNVGERSEQEL